MNQVFNWSSKNLIAQILLGVLGLLSLWGVQWNMPVTELSEKIYLTFTEGGYWSLVSLFAGSILMPVWSFIRKKDKEPLSVFIKKPNTWVYLIMAALSGLTLLGIKVDTTVAGQIVQYITARDWGALIGAIFTAILSPLLRFLLEKQMSRLKA